MFSTNYRYFNLHCLIIQVIILHWYNTSYLNKEKILSMSVAQMTKIPTNKRYTVNIKSVFLYQMVFYLTEIIDNSLGVKYKIAFRFSQIRNFHNTMLEKYSEDFAKQMPQLPPTRSFLLWNQTNGDEDKIQRRRRELQFYIQMLFNNASSKKQNQIVEKLLFGQWFAWSKAKSIELLEEADQQQKANTMPLRG